MNEGQGTLSEFNAVLACGACGRRTIVPFNFDDFQAGFSLRDQKEVQATIRCPQCLAYNRVSEHLCE